MLKHGCDCLFSCFRSFRLLLLCKFSNGRVVLMMLRGKQMRGLDNRVFFLLLDLSCLIRLLCIFCLRFL